MSILTMNWALNQRLESHQLQILLYVIADSTDPSGVTRHCDPHYMAERARMTRATMFRRLGELEKLGLLQRLKFYNESGTPIYEIRLDLDARVDMPIKRRRSGGEDDGTEDGGDDDHEGGEAADDAARHGPESQGETPLDADQSLTQDVTKVSPRAAPESHSCDSISPPLPPISKNLPPNPPPGGSQSRVELEQGEKRDALWERFKATYPKIGTMDQAAARDELDALPLDDVEWAISVIPAYVAEIAGYGKHGKPPLGAHLWLRKGIFRNYPRGKIEAPPPEGVWIAEGSEADRALAFARHLARVAAPFVLTRPGGARGYLHRSAAGADLVAMLAFAGQSQLRWLSCAPGSHEFAAWQSRFNQWVGKGLPVDAGDGTIRVPCQWPPKKDGTLYTAADAPVVPAMTQDDINAFANEGKSR